MFRRVLEESIHMDELLELVNNLVLIFDSSGRLTLHNESFVRALELAQEDVQNGRAEDLFKERCPTLLKDIEFVMKEKQSKVERKYQKLATQGGNTLIVHYSVSSYLDLLKDETSGVIVIIEDSYLNKHKLSSSNLLSDESAPTLPVEELSE